MKTTCEACVKGKHHRVPFSKRSKWRATERLQLIHSDLCGPINSPSNSQIRYFISFIDDFSRKTWIYFLLEKSEAFYQFKTFKAFVEKQTGLFIKCLRTNRGGEYNSIAFKELCKAHGIKRQLTIAFTPQQNGVVERKNRTIMNMVRAAFVTTLNFHISRVTTNVPCSSIKWKYNSYLNIIYNVNFKNV